MILALEHLMIEFIVDTGKTVIFVYFITRRVLNRSFTNFALQTKQSTDFVDTVVQNRTSVWVLVSDGTLFLSFRAEKVLLVFWLVRLLEAIFCCEAQQCRLIGTASKCKIS